MAQTCLYYISIGCRVRRYSLLVTVTHFALKRAYFSVFHHPRQWLRFLSLSLSILSDTMLLPIHLCDQRILSISHTCVRARASESYILYSATETKVCFANKLQMLQSTYPSTPEKMEHARSENFARYKYVSRLCRPLSVFRFFFIFTCASLPFALASSHFSPPSGNSYRKLL